MLDQIGRCFVAELTTCFDLDEIDADPPGIGIDLNQREVCSAEVPVVVAVDVTILAKQVLVKIERNRDRMPKNPLCGQVEGG